MATQDLEDLLSAIGVAVLDALKAIDGHSVQTFMGHFETPGVATGESGAVQPRTIAVPLPAADGTYRSREVPTVALLHHNSLQLEEIRFKFRVALSQAEENHPLRAELVAPAKTPPAAGDGKTAADETDTKPNFAEVDMLFKRGDPPEGVARISNEYHKIL